MPSLNVEFFIHVPNLIPSIKYMKESTFESIKSDIYNYSLPMGTSTVVRLRFKLRTFHVPNLMQKLLSFISSGKQSINFVNKLGPTYF